MLYNLFKPFSGDYHLANLFNYITFRCGAAVMVSFLFIVITGPWWIRFLSKWQINGQPIRSDGPKSHFAKLGTPTMGGIFIIISILLSSLMFADVKNHFIWIILGVLLTYATLGFADDYFKVKKNNSKGLSVFSKLVIQFIVALIACYYIEIYSPEKYYAKLFFPFMKNFSINLGWFYLVFASVVIVGASNAVNLTDGLDGLVSMPIIMCALCYCMICYFIGNKVFANYLIIPYIPGSGEVSIICAAVMGAVLGFLWFNAHPAQIIMGDTGSLALGGFLGTVSVLSKHEILLSIVGGVFVVEALSVVLQVGYFKITKGKRIFRMSPLHHHFEQIGWSEPTVVTRFWVVSIILSLIGLASLKVR